MQTKPPSHGHATNQNHAKVQRAPIFYIHVSSGIHHSEQQVINCLSRQWKPSKGVENSLSHDIMNTKGHLLYAALSVHIQHKLRGKKTIMN